MKKVLVMLLLTLAVTLTASAGKKIVVNLSQQRACAYEGGRTVFCGNISTGKPGHRTPNGHFRVLEKDIDHVSSKYPEPNGGAKMHYMLRLTSSGIAMHLGYVPNYPASHGCIRMQSGFAQQMYNWAHVGVPVRVIGTPPARVSRSSYRSTYRTSRTSRRARTRRTYNANATDILAEFMGHTTRRKTVSTRKKSRRQIRRHRRTSRKHSHRRTPRTRHANPLATIASR